MKTLLVFLAAMGITLYAFAQVPGVQPPETSDPAAKALMKKMETKLRQDRLGIDFTLTIQNPGDDPIIQKGTFIQQGEKYKVNGTDWEVWSDGVTRWVYQKEVNEVNIYSAKDDADVMNPISIFTQFMNSDYIAFLAGAETVRSIPTSVLEIKPTDRGSDIAKLRVFAKEDGTPVRLEIFEKTASHTTLDVGKLYPVEKQTSIAFTFDKSKYPGVHVEDLRID